MFRSGLDFELSLFSNCFCFSDRTRALVLFHDNKSMPLRITFGIGSERQTITATSGYLAGGWVDCVFTCFAEIFFLVDGLPSHPGGVIKLEHRAAGRLTHPGMSLPISCAQKTHFVVKKHNNDHAHSMQQRVTHLATKCGAEYIAVAMQHVVRPGREVTSQAGNEAAGFQARMLQCTTKDNGLSKLAVTISPYGMVRARHVGNDPFYGKRIFRSSDLSWGT